METTTSSIIVLYNDNGNGNEVVCVALGYFCATVIKYIRCCMISLGGSARKAHYPAKI